MATAKTLDLDRLLAPLGDGGGAGVNLRDVSHAANRELYDTIRSARQAARKKEASASAGAPSTEMEDWQNVRDQCVEAIGSRCKDLELATYLIDAATRVDGFAGLRDSLTVYSGLIANYWGTLFPPLEEGSAASRVVQLGALNGDGDREGSLCFAIARVPITNGNNDFFGLFHRECGVSLETLAADKQASRIAAGWVTLGKFEESAQKTPHAFLQNLLEDLQQSGQELDKVRAALADQCGADAPSTGKIRAAIDACIVVVEKYAKANAPMLNDAGVGPKTEGNMGSAAGGECAIPQTFRNRNEAFEVIMRVADYFKKTEPQSPVIFALEQSVRWGKMNLPELMTELIVDENSRRQLFKLVGIPMPNNPQQF